MNKVVFMVVYDLPVATKTERTEVAAFRRNLIRLGYVSMQKSVYVKLLRGSASILTEVEKVDRIKPKVGLVHVLPVRFSDFEKLKVLVGKQFNMSAFADDILVL